MAEVQINRYARPVIPTRTVKLDDSIPEAARGCLGRKQVHLPPQIWNGTEDDSARLKTLQYQQRGFSQQEFAVNDNACANVRVSDFAGNPHLLLNLVGSTIEDGLIGFFAAIKFINPGDNLFSAYSRFLPSTRIMVDIDDADPEALEMYFMDIDMSPEFQDQAFDNDGLIVIHLFRENILDGYPGVLRIINAVLEYDRA